MEDFLQLLNVRFPLPVLWRIVRMLTLVLRQVQQITPSDGSAIWPTCHRVMPETAVVVPSAKTEVEDGIVHKTVMNLIADAHNVDTSKFLSAVHSCFHHYTTPENFLA